MKQQNKKHLHFFDYVHLVKNCRNELLNSVVKDREGVSSSMCDLWEGYQQYQPEWEKELNADHFVPSDKMEIDPVLKLMQDI